HWARSDDPRPTPAGRAAHRVHVKAEFHAPGVGWVPVDLSSAVESDKSPEGLKYFGHDAGDFLATHLDYDVELDTGFSGVKSVRHLQNIHYYFRGTGNVDSPTIDRTWHVETLR
ncbi:MAG TPA: hypothetical protein VMF30_00845, partial [Pirellulales bacterium]|nr:hypothetical protein [Pirellulales bacterium]